MNISLALFSVSNMPKPILIRPDEKLAKQIERAAREEDRKSGPMVVILLRRYFAQEQVNERQA